MTSWNCSTTAGLSGDASARQVERSRRIWKFCRCFRFGEIEMPLAKTLQRKIKITD